MTALVAILWTIYLSECFARVRRDDWIFRRGAFGGYRGISEPDAQFLDGGLAFAWTALLPWSAVYLVAGSKLDASFAKTRLALIARRRRFVVAGASSLFFLVLVIFPALALTNTIAPAVPYLGGAVALAWVVTLKAFFSTYRAIHGTRPPVETWLTHALSPLSLIRAPHVLAIRTIADAHPVAAAAELCADDEFLRIARLWHFDAPETRERIERIATARRLGRSLIDPPGTGGAGATVFCPRCHAVYFAQRDECRDCADVQLLPLPSSAAHNVG